MANYRTQKPQVQTIMYTVRFQEAHRKTALFTRNFLLLDSLPMARSILKLYSQRWEPKIARQYSKSFSRFFSQNWTNLLSKIFS